MLEACARPECLERVHDLLGDLWADAPDVPPADRIGFETAVAEIAADIVEHADGGEGGEIDLAVELLAYADRVEASFRDTGNPSTSTSTPRRCRTPSRRRAAASRSRPRRPTRSSTSATAR